MKNNPVTQIDAYKIGHKSQYDPGTTLIFSNLTARSTRRLNTDKVVFAGLQYFLKEFLVSQWNENFFQQPIEKVVGDFNRRINNFLGPNNVGDEHIQALHKLGYLPIVVLALPEGTEHPIKVPSLVIWNTLPEFFWITNYLETILSTTIWGMCTTATTSHQYKKLLTKYALETVGNTDFVQWQAHDFSFRGMFGLEAAKMSGAAHLFSFTGTDTVPAVDFLEEYYNADCEKELIGGSVAATEHSVACSVILNFVEKLRIEKTEDGEVIIEDDLMDLADIEYVRHLIQDVYPTGIVSIVADSFDYWNTITNTARVLKNVILTRNGKVVFRPDTGDPVKVVVGYKWRKVTDWYEEDFFAAADEGYEVVCDVRNGISHYFRFTDPTNTSYIEEISEAEVKGSIECLWEIFGGTPSNQGYKVLDSHVGLIYGDSITLQRAEEICEGLKQKSFASTNIVFGVGSFSFQYVTRDTDGYAVKATYAEVNGKSLPIFKSPKGAEFKKSAKGLTAVFKDANGEFYLKDQATWEEVLNCEFVKVFENGNLIKDYTLQEVRDNLAQYI